MLWIYREDARGAVSRLSDIVIKFIDFQRRAVRACIIEFREI